MKKMSQRRKNNETIFSFHRFLGSLLALLPKNAPTKLSASLMRPNEYAEVNASDGSVRESPKEKKRWLK